MARLSRDSQAFPVMVDFTVDADRQQALVDFLIDLMPIFADQPGFLAAHIHRSLDGSRVVNYLQWRSRADHEACLNNPEVMAGGKPLIDFLETHRISMNVHAYEIVLTAEA